MYLYIFGGTAFLGCLIYLLRILWRERTNRFNKGVLSHFYYFVCVAVVLSMFVCGLLFGLFRIIELYGIQISDLGRYTLVTIFIFFFAVMAIGMAFSPGIGIILFASRSIFEGISMYRDVNRVSRYSGGPTAIYLGFFYLLIGLVAFNFPIWMAVSILCWKNNQGLCWFGNSYVGLFNNLIRLSNKSDFLLVAFGLWILYMVFRTYAKVKK